MFEWKKSAHFPPSLKSVRELLIFILSGFRQVIFKKPEDFIMISCTFSNGLMEINFQATVKAFMPSVCRDYKYSPAAQDYSFKWNWKVHTKVLSYKVRPYHTKPCLTWDRQTDSPRQGQCNQNYCTLQVYHWVTVCVLLPCCKCKGNHVNFKLPLWWFLGCHQSRASDVHHQGLLMGAIW